MEAVPKVEIKDFTFWPVRATARTVWLVVQVRTSQGISGLEEASDAFEFAATTAAQGREMESMLGRFVGLMVGRSPLEISYYRKMGEPLARSGGLVAATAYRAVRQALGDLVGLALGVPTSTLFGGALKATPAGFAATAKRAVREGFRAVKAAPWDGYSKVTAEEGMACTEAMRMAVGAGVDVMVYCHSLFSVAEAVIMPDVKHCGGMLALTHILAMAASYGVAVVSHNPSGPVSTAATGQAATGLNNCEILEMQWGEVEWRGELVAPTERFENGEMILGERAGLGIGWNEELARRNGL